LRRGHNALHHLDKYIRETGCVSQIATAFIARMTYPLEVSRFEPRRLSIGAQLAGKKRPASEWQRGPSFLSSAAICVTWSKARRRCHRCQRLTLSCIQVRLA
jgi:hypothetical protein